MRCKNCGTEWSVSIHGNSVQKFCPVCGKSVMPVQTNPLASLEETLLVIVRDYGMDNLSDGTRAMAFFTDLAPHLRKEKVMLQHLIRCDGNTLLISALHKTPGEQQSCRKQLVARMMDDLFVSEAAAEWICSSFWNAITFNEKPPARELSPEELYNSGCEKERADFKTAFHMITKAAEAGYTPAQEKLAKWYRDGSPAGKDAGKAFFWYQKAAASGDPESQCNLGWCFATGFGCKPDPASAVMWFGKAADAGLSVAKYNLAKCYEKGMGVKMDYSHAALLYEQAAKANHVKAQYCMGRCYENGSGLPKDMDLAIFWYKKAAHNGSADAQFTMGRCYELGIGFDKDPDIAYYWYKQAADHGHTKGKAKVKRLARGG